MARSGPLRAWALVLLVIFLLWFLPRLAVRLGGPQGPWTPYLYQYLLGGLVFTIGLVVILASGACNLRRPGDLGWFLALVGGFLAYAAMHALVTWVAYRVPFKGALP